MPNVLIETLGGDRKRIRAAYYYDVPVGIQLPGAVDSTREPQRGVDTNLNQAAKDGLKAGTVYEYLRSFDIDPAWTIAEIRSQLEADRLALQAIAAAEYKDKFQFVGRFFDGTDWG